MAETSTRLGRVSLVPRGAYDAAAVYNRLDIVEHEGSGYLVLADGTTGVPPEAGPVYMLLSARGGRGDPGAPGTPGATGETGPQGETGTGVQSIERTAGDGSPGTTDTYTITMTDGSTAVFTVYNGADGTSFTVLGRYDTLDELTSDHPTGGEGEAWAVGSAEDNDIYLWNVDTQTWDNIGTLQGPAGADGADGKSAYQQAVDGGYTGTEAEFNAILSSGPWLPTSGGEIIPIKNSYIRFFSDPDGNEGYPIPVIKIGANNATFEIKVAEDESYINFDGGELVINNKIYFDVNGRIRTPLNAPIRQDEVTNKKYVDDQVGDIASILDSINGEVV